MRPHRLLITLLVALAAAWHAPFAFAEDDDEGTSTRPQDTQAVAVNTKDGKSIFELAFAIKKVAGEVVDNTNLAVAYSSCQECRSIAISVQIVLVTGSPSTVTPQNVAIAVNDNCTSCETLALAYQWVLGVDEDAQFTKEGLRELHDIYKELKRLKHSDAPVAEIAAQVKALMARLDRVLRTELRVPDRRGGDDDDEDDDSATRSGETTQSTTTTTTTTTSASTDTGTTSTSTPTETGTTTGP